MPTHNPPNANPKKTDIQNLHLWEFPMEYPMSVIGHEGERERLLEEVACVVTQVFPDFDAKSVRVQPSKTGRYHALRFKVHFTCAEEVNRLYALLDQAKTVRTAV